MTQAMPKGVPQANGERVPKPVMDVEHVAQAVLQMAQLPLDTNVQFMTIMATRMPFIGRGLIDSIVLIATSPVARPCEGCLGLQIGGVLKA